VDDLQRRIRITRELHLLRWLAVETVGYFVERETIAFERLVHLGRRHLAQRFAIPGLKIALFQLTNNGLFDKPRLGGISVPEWSTSRQLF
jgi:hypothetical protein